jgi:hypothetical protein
VAGDNEVGEDGNLFPAPGGHSKSTQWKYPRLYFLVWRVAAFLVISGHDALEILPFRYSHGSQLSHNANIGFELFD